MSSKIKTTTAVSVIAVMVMLTFLVGCGNDAGNNALIGGAIGAGVGQLIGGDTKATMIGAGIGAGAGYVIGSQSDKKKSQSATDSAISGDVVEMWVTNSNGSKTSVKLTPQGSGYVGPKGEYYESMPTEEQLKEAYGF